MTTIPFAFILLFALTPIARAGVLLSNLDTARKDAKPSPFHQGNGKASLSRKPARNRFVVKTMLAAVINNKSFHEEI